MVASFGIFAALVLQTSIPAVASFFASPVAATMVRPERLAPVTIEVDGRAVEASKSVHMVSVWTGNPRRYQSWYGRFLPWIEFISDDPPVDGANVALATPIDVNDRPRFKASTSAAAAHRFTVAMPSDALEQSAAWGMYWGARLSDTNVEIVSSGVAVDVDEGATSAPLVSGDVITTVNGTGVHDVADVHAAIQALPSGATVSLELADGRTIRWRLSGIGEAAVAQAGMRLSVAEPAIRIERDVELPADVGKGGSNGLAFALTTYLALSDDDILAGRKVAASGAVGATGDVLSVDYLRQKSKLVADGNVDIFIVPTGGGKDASRFIDSTRTTVIEAATVADAVEYLQTSAT